jgi:hypothetical protein
MKSFVLSEELRIQGYSNTDQTSDRRQRAELGPAQRGGFELRAPDSAFMDRDKVRRVLEEYRGLLSVVLGRHSVRALRE